MDHTTSSPVLALRAPYDFARSIRFWRISTGELCEQWADGVYRRVLTIDNLPAIMSLHNVGTVEQPAVAVAVDERPASAHELRVLEPAIRHLLGDDLDLRAFYAAVAHDPVFAPVTQYLYGLKPTRSPLWETLCYVIIGQQISVPFAYKLKERLVTRYGEPFDAGGRPLYRFPTPAVLAAADPAELAPMQFRRNRSGFIIGLAQQIMGGALDLDRLQSMPTPEAIVYLTRFRGIGAWTAEFTLMRGIGRADAIPANDAGVRNGIAKLYGERLAEEALRAFAERWGAWGGTAALYLLGWQREVKKS
jgi:DNA-3-methyladenine glycosylase II